MQKKNKSEIYLKAILDEGQLFMPQIIGDFRAKKEFEE